MLDDGGSEGGGGGDGGRVVRIGMVVEGGVEGMKAVVVDEKP